MKTLRLPSLPGSAAIAALLSLTAGAPAANLFWGGGTADILTDGNGASEGGAGTWDTILLNWDAGAAPHVAWNNGAGDTAVFAGTAGAINVPSPITAGGLTFLANGFTFTGTPVELASGAVVKGANTTYNLAGLALAAGNTTWRFASSSTAATFANANVFRISEMLTGGGAVVVSGTQPFYLTALTGLNYSGGTTVEPGAALGFDTSDTSGLPVGSVTVGANAAILRRGQNLTNAVLQLLAATTEEFTIYGNNGTCANALDLSGTNGGTDLPNASLAFWDNAGTRSFAYSGTITPGSNGYRFGGSKAANYINLTTANTLTGSHRLTLLTGRLRLRAENDITGDTLASGGTIFVATPLALQNSALDTSGAGFIDVSGPQDGYPNAAAPPIPVPTPTFGGLKGSKDIAATFNASYTTAGGGVSSLTLNPGDGVTNSYSGAISDGAPGMTLTKTGIGTQELSGANTWTGATTVTGGTLAFGGGSMASAITVQSGASLGFTLAATTTSTGSVTFDAGSNVRITGTPTLPAYTLMTAASFAGIAPALDAPIPGFELAVTGGNTLVLNATGSSPYSTWAGGAGFNDDANDDGLANGIAWMLGAASPAANAHAILPAPQTSGGSLTLHLQRVVPRGAAKLLLQHGTVLNGWTTVEIPAASATIAGGIVVTVTPGSPTEDVTVQLPAALAAPGGRLFVRLMATEN